MAPVRWRCDPPRRRREHPDRVFPSADRGDRGRPDRAALLAGLPGAERPAVGDSRHHGRRCPGADSGGPRGSHGRAQPRRRARCGPPGPGDAAPRALAMAGREGPLGGLRDRGTRSEATRPPGARPEAIRSRRGDPAPRVDRRWRVHGGHREGGRPRQRGQRRGGPSRLRKAVPGVRRRPLPALRGEPAHRHPPHPPRAGQRSDDRDPRPARRRPHPRLARSMAGGRRRAPGDPADAGRPERMARGTCRPGGGPSHNRNPALDRGARDRIPAGVGPLPRGGSGAAPSGGDIGGGGMSVELRGGSARIAGRAHRPGGEQVSVTPSDARTRTMRAAIATANDYVTLTKPRIISLLLLTCVATMFGGYLAAGGAGAINHYIEREPDARMERTAGRPLASGRIEPRRGLLFGSGLGVVAVAQLGITVNALTAALAAAGLLGYVFVYTLWLKP